MTTVSLSLSVQRARRAVLSLLAGVLAATLPLAAQAPAQRVLPTTPLPARPADAALDPLVAFGGAEVLIASPTGEFAGNVGTGFGIGVHGRVPFDALGLLSLRGDLGFINYGNETIRICVTTPCRVTGDLTTSNNIFFAGLGPELSVGHERARIYANASGGFAYFNTSSSVSGTGNQGDPFAESTNHSDATFAWMTGGGAQFRISGGRTPVSLDLGARYHGNGEAEYLRRGDIEDRPDGSVVVHPQRSDTNLWTFRIGVSVGVPRGEWQAPRRDLW